MNCPEGRPGYRTVSTDQIRADLYGDAAIQGSWGQVWARVIDQLRQGAADIHRGDLTGVVYDATNVRRRDRRRFIQTVRALGYPTVAAVWFDFPLSCCLERNRARSRQVPEAVILKMHRQLVATQPSLSEGFEQIWRMGPARLP